MRALIPPPVPAGIIRYGSRLGEPALDACRTIRRLLPDNMLHTATSGYLLLPSQHRIKYLDDTLIVFAPQHLLYHPPAPFPDSSVE